MSWIHDLLIHNGVLQDLFGHILLFKIEINFNQKSYK